MPPPVQTVTVSVSEEERNKWEEERAKLYEQLDEKVTRFGKLPLQ